MKKGRNPSRVRTQSYISSQARMIEAQRNLIVNLNQRIENYEKQITLLKMAIKEKDEYLDELISGEVRMP